MDPEKFDKVLLDVLYDEADEVTRAAAERHMNQSERARRIFEDLRVAREIGQLPLVDAPLGLEARILAAERAARSERSLGARLGGIVSLVASYTMRPQMGMAALLLLMLGSSLLLLRAKPGAHDSVQVTERGVPESEVESVTVVPVPRPEALADEERRRDERRAAKSPARNEGESSVRNEGESAGPAAALGAAPRDEKREGLKFPTVDETASGRAKADKQPDPFEDAMTAYEQGRYAEAEQRFDDVARSSDPSAATAELYAARSTQRTSGCGSAVERFEHVATRHPGTDVGHEASWLAAECHRQLGNPERAATTYRALLDAPGYGDKATRALAAMSEPAAEPKATAARRAAAAQPARPASKPAAAATADP